MAFQQKIVSHAGKLRIENVRGTLGAFYLPAGLPSEPEDIWQYRVWSEQELKGHLITAFGRNDLVKLCQKHNIACGSNPSRLDLVRAVCSSCIRPQGVERLSMAHSAMGPLQIEEMERRVQERLQPDMKKATPSEWKQLEQMAKKMWADWNQIPGFRDGWNELSGEEILAFPKIMAQIAREEKAMKEKEMLFDEAGEPLGIDDAPSPSGMSRSAIIRKAIADAFGEGELQEIFVQKHNEDVVIFEGLMPTSRLTAQHLLDELCDLQRVDANSLVLCNQRGDRIDLMKILSDYVREEGPTIYLRPSGLAGGGYGRGVPKTKKSTVSKKKSGYKRLMDEFIDEFKDVPSNENITFRTQAEEVMSIFYQEAEVDAAGAFEKAFSQMSLPALKRAIEATASDSGGDTDSKLKRLSVLMFGKVIEDAKEVNDITGGLLEGAELTTCTAFHSDEDISLKSLRLLLQKFHDKKEGAMEASQMEM